MAVCIICHENLTSGESIKTSCNHYYHLTCLAEWSVRKDDCPCCRKEEPMKVADEAIEEMKRIHRELVVSIGVYIRIVKSLFVKNKESLFPFNTALYDAIVEELKLIGDFLKDSEGLFDKAPNYGTYYSALVYGTIDSIYDYLSSALVKLNNALSFFKGIIEVFLWKLNQPHPQRASFVENIRAIRTFDEVNRALLIDIFSLNANTAIKRYYIYIYEKVILS